MDVIDLKSQLLDFLKVVVERENLGKHWVQVTLDHFCPVQLENTQNRFTVLTFIYQLYLNILIGYFPSWFTWKIISIIEKLGLHKQIAVKVYLCLPMFSSLRNMSVYRRANVSFCQEADIREDWRALTFSLCVLNAHVVVCDCLKRKSWGLWGSICSWCGIWLSINIFMLSNLSHGQNISMKYIYIYRGLYHLIMSHNKARLSAIWMIMLTFITLIVFQF